MLIKESKVAAGICIRKLWLSLVTPSVSFKTHTPRPVLPHWKSSLKFIIPVFFTVDTAYENAEERDPCWGRRRRSGRRLEWLPLGRRLATDEARRRQVEATAAVAVVVPLATVLAKLVERATELCAVEQFYHRRFRYDAKVNVKTSSSWMRIRNSGRTIFRNLISWFP